MKKLPVKDIKDPVFVFGCCNSGTTILWEALKRHGDFCGPDVEGQDLNDLPDSMRHHLGKSTFRLWAHPNFNRCYYATEADCNENDRGKIMEVYGRYAEPGKRFITKSPADTLRARLIQGYFPDASFLAIVRNGYAVSEGIVRKRKLDPDRPEYEGLFTTIDEAAEQWYRSNTIILSHGKFLNKYKIIKYEDLVENPEDTLYSVLDFCCADKKKFHAPEFRTDLNTEQIGRLSEYEIETVTRVAKPLLIHFGYDVLGGGLKW
jgi:hypothetical protein